MAGGWTKKLFSFTIILLGIVIVNGCGSKRVPQTLPSGLATVDRSAVIRTAASQLGKPYQYGGISPQTGFDCSGFTHWVYGQHGVALPRRSSDQMKVGKRVSGEKLREADLVFFDIDGKGSLHVGIYMNGGTFIHSPSRGGRVRRDYFSDRYWQRSFLEGRNLLP